MENTKRLTLKQVEELDNTSELFVVFEEDDAEKPKMYDLLLGVYATKDAALSDKKFFESKKGVSVYVTKYDDYMNGNYSYINE